jgi:hypothetical protein
MTNNGRLRGSIVPKKLQPLREIESVYLTIWMRRRDDVVEIKLE